MQKPAEEPAAVRRELTDEEGTFMLDDDAEDNIEDILNELKERNIEKGIRNVEDTQINIMSELKKEELMRDQTEPAVEEKTATGSVKPEKKSLFQSFFGVSDEEIDDYQEEEDEEPVTKKVEKPVKIAEEYSEDEIEQTNSSIMKAIADMKPIEDGEMLYDEETSYDTTQGYPAPMMQKTREQEHINVLTAQIEKERKARDELFETTQQLKLQVSEYENDLNEVSNNMSRTNRILNVILTLLIIALFVILFIMGFFFAKERGLI